MKPSLGNRTTRWLLARWLLAISVAAVGLTLQLPAEAAGVALATTPMATSTVTTVKPNLMFVLDDSGSMDWDFMPDTASAFAGNYGFNSSQCNGVYYDPDVTYIPPVNSTGGPLNAVATTFNVAYVDGFNKAAGTVNLSTQFKGGSGSGASGNNLTPGPAFYYTYSGNQKTAALKTYFNTNSNFYKECDSNVGATTVIDGAAVNTRFTQVRLALTPSTTFTVSGAGGAAGATLQFQPFLNKNQVSSITVGSSQILNGTTAFSTSVTTLKALIVAGINACTLATTGKCTATGYSASLGASGITINGPATAAGVTPAVVRNGVATFTVTAFPSASSTTVSSITVGGVQLLSANATGTTPSSLATAIKNNILATGYSTTVTGSTVTLIGPSSASNLTPAITISSGTMTVATQAFPEASTDRLQNFANWYSYYSNRMIMMKTSAGLAFNQVTDAYRVGFATMNNNVSPGLVEVGPFNDAQRVLWYKKLYEANPGGGTPLREILSRVGQYYASKFGNDTTYKATITVGGSGNTSADSITINTASPAVEMMQDASVLAATTAQVAKYIADQINAMVVTDYGATAAGNVVTIFGPAGALGKTPVITDDGGGMTYAVTSFTSTSTTSKFNGVVPLDPIEYSCQQNFTILSTDGYWNGATTYDLANNPVGQQDGLVGRPYNDGAQPNTKETKTWLRTTYSSSGTALPGGTNCPSPKKRVIAQDQIETCDITTTKGVAGAEVCTAWASNGNPRYVSPYDNTAASCVTTTPTLGTTGRVASGDPVTTPGAVGGPANTLADVALYYYQTDLRDQSLNNCDGRLQNGSSVCTDDVFINGTDNNQRQHMTTFTLGLGARGRMVYSSSYLKDISGDYYSVKLGLTASATVCTWQTAGTVCNWPVPSSGAIENIDDLWHAAVNGRGAFFSATDPTSLANGLANALVSIKSKVGSAAAAATSTLNPVAGNNFAYVASYTTQKWQGNLEARGINTDNGTVSENATWCVENVAPSTCVFPGTIQSDTSGDTTAYFCVTPNSTVCTDGDLVGTDCRVPAAVACTGTMNALVGVSSDKRTIYTAKADGTALIPFDLAYRAANPTYFDATLLAKLGQWPAASDTSGAAVAFRANAPGDNLLYYLRGQNGHQFNRSSVPPIDQFYRNREAVMGDALESQPAYMGPPIFSYAYKGYTEFVTAQASRVGTVYMGTNDGMMHAFNASDGVERWAYIPSMVVGNMWRLADQNYADLHTNYVNGSAITSDICTANCTNTYNAGTPTSNPVWKTILVAGLNGGGRGYFALDITTPTAPTLLWEFTTSAGIGKTKDNDLGYTFGQPVITLKSDGTWVVLVTSGYDNGTDSAIKNSGGTLIANSPAGSGIGYLYVLNAATGAIISKISTAVGTATSPSGLAKIAGYNSESGGNKASYVYGGDLLGNLWRFDINSTTSATTGTGSAFKFATLYSDGTTANAAGTTTQPIVTTPQLGNILGKRVIFIGTGKYLETADLTTTSKQTQYAIKDDDATTTLVNPRTTLVQNYLINDPAGTATRLSSGSAGGGAATTANKVDFSTGRGWFVDLPDSRERVNIDAKLVLGTLVVPSIVPSATDCAPGGTGWLNFFDYTTGGAVVVTPGAAATTSVKYDSTIVGLNILFIDGLPVVEVVTSTKPTPEKNSNVTFKATTAGFTGKRVLWRELIP